MQENINTIEDMIGFFSGAVGYVLSKFSIGVQLFVLAQWLPDLHALVTTGINVISCSILGFITTRLCHAVYKYIRLKIKSKKNENNS